MNTKCPGRVEVGRSRSLPQLHQSVVQRTQDRGWTSLLYRLRDLRTIGKVGPLACEGRNDVVCPRQRWPVDRMAHLGASRKSCNEQENASHLNPRSRWTFSRHRWV